MEESGKNRTPDKLATSEREPLFEACDRSLRRIVDLVEPGMIVGVGKFAEACAKRVLGDLGIPIGTVLHPSPASPIANRGWAPQAERQLADMGLLPAK
jgi:single-strand selective monofunctional uracil DNA glycosylase